MKVLIVSTPFIPVPPPTYGGLERIVFDLAAGLRQLGVDVTVACPTESRLPAGVKHLNIGPARYQVQQDWIQAEREAFEEYKTHLKEFDIVHDHSVSGDSYIFARDSKGGRLLTIEQYFNEKNGQNSGCPRIDGDKTISLNQAGKVREHRITAVTRHETDELCVLRLECGFTLRVTGEHALFVYDKKRRRFVAIPAREALGKELLVPLNVPLSEFDTTELKLSYLEFPESFYIKAANLSAAIQANRKLLLGILPGKYESKQSRISRWKRMDYLPVRYAKHLPPLKVESVRPHHGGNIPTLLPIGDSLLVFMGLWVGDGCYDTNGLRLSCANDKECLDIIENVARDFQGHVTPIRNGVNVTLASTALKELWRVLGFSDGAARKKLPEFVFSLSRRQIGLVLRGYFSADGGFRRNTFVISTASRDLCEQTSFLLLGIGIRHSKGIDRSETGFGIGNTRYELSIPKSEYAKLSEKVGLCQQYKAERLLQKVAVRNSSKRFRRRIGDVRFVRVLEIEKLQGRFHVYDLSVEQTERFFANSILVHNSWYGWPYVARAEDDSLRIMHTHHGHLNWTTPPPVRHANLVGISQYMAGVYSGQLGVPTRCVYNGVALEDYPFNPRPGTRLIYLGRIAKFKQAHVAIDVARRAGVPVDILGGDRFVDDFSYVGRVRDACDGLHARYIGEVPHDLKLRYLQKSRAILISSNMGEPFGLVAVEALATGRPVICLNDGALGEIVRPSVGFVCQTPDQMVEVIKGERDRTISPEHCRRRAEEFSKERMARQYEHLYGDILRGDEW